MAYAREVLALNLVKRLALNLVKLRIILISNLSLLKLPRCRIGIAIRTRGII
jgi:hypothetical protein